MLLYSILCPNIRFCPQSTNLQQIPGVAKFALRHLSAIKHKFERTTTKFVGRLGVKVDVFALSQVTNLFSHISCFYSIVWIRALPFILTYIRH